MLALAYVGVDIWNIVARRSTAKSPLIAAIILAAAALIVIIVFMATKSTRFQIGGLGLNALIISRAAIVLRMKKVPVPAAAQNCQGYIPSFNRLLTLFYGKKDSRDSGRRY